MEESQRPLQEERQLPVEVFQTMERRDENQILAEMQGELVEELVYDIQIQGRRVTNLSYAGVKEATRRRGNIEILEVRTEETDNEIRALVRVRDHDNRIDVLGASAAEKSKPFAYTLAVNKAERSASNSGSAKARLVGKSTGKSPDSWPPPSRLNLYGKGQNRQLTSDPTSHSQIWTILCLASGD